MVQPAGFFVLLVLLLLDRLLVSLDRISFHTLAFPSPSPLLLT